MITLRRIVLTALVGLSFALFVIGFQMTRSQDTPACVSTPLEVKAVYPPCGDLDLRQTRIGFQLDSAYTGRLDVDRTPVPDDQLQKIVGLNQFFFLPRAGTDVGALKPGQHTATVTYWRIGASESTGKSFTWQFNSH